MDAIVETILAMFRTGDFADFCRAAEAVKVLGPAAKAAVPALIHNLDGFASSKPTPSADWNKITSQNRVLEALAEIGPDARAAVPAIIERINQRNGPIFFKVLGRIGSEAKDAAPFLQNWLEAKDCRVRLAPAGALTRIVPDQCSIAVGVLQRLKYDPELATVWGPPTNRNEFMSRKQDFDNPTSRFYRLAASVPLWKLGLENEPPLPALLKELECKKNSVDEISLIELLADLGSEAKPALPKLATFLWQALGSGQRRAAAIAIRRIDPAEAGRLNLPGVLALP